MAEKLLNPITFLSRCFFINILIKMLSKKYVGVIFTPHGSGRVSHLAFIILMLLYILCHKPQLKQTFVSRKKYCVQKHCTNRMVQVKFTHDQQFACNFSVEISLHIIVSRVFQKESIQVLCISKCTKVAKHQVQNSLEIKFDPSLRFCSA